MLQGNMATLTQRLKEAEDAYHNLQTGQSAVEVRDANGSMVRYTAANTARLKAYIEDLKVQLGQKPARGPMWLV